MDYQMDGIPEKSFDELDTGDMVIYDNDVWYIKHIFSDGYIMIEKDGGMETSQGEVKEVFYTDI